MVRVTDVLTAEPTAAPSSAEGTRAATIGAAIAEFSETAFHRVTLDSVALRADLPVEVVRAQFPTFEDLVAATVRQWYARRMSAVLPIAHRDGAVALLRAILESNVADPGLMHLLPALVNITATWEHPLSSSLQQQWLHFYALVQRTLTDDALRGREPSTLDPASGTEQLIALYEGLQLQAMVRPAMNLLGAFDRAVLNLRDSWALPSDAPVWTI